MSLLVTAMLVISCSGLLKKNEDAGADGAADVDAATATTTDTDAAATPSAALATNEANIARFPDEVKLAGNATSTQRVFSAREAPPAGAVVATLPKGTAVTQIAQRGNYFLVTFESPPGTKMMGWLHQFAFLASNLDAGVKPLTCTAPEIPLVSDTPFCGKLCGADTDCPTGQACKGTANKLSANGKAGDGVTVCTVWHQPPPPPTPVVDAGKPADAAAPVADASAPPAVDAGKPADAGPAPSGTQDVVAPTGGKCPGNFILVNKTGKCHRPCPTSVTQCQNRPNFFCIKCDNDTKRVCGDSQTQCR